ncbi:MAG: STAS/SEC14 domain-containing protein [Desulfuromonadales bacterium]
MYERLNLASDNALAYRISQPLSKDEMHMITTELGGSISGFGKIRGLIDLQSFPYADLPSFWEDLKFDIKFAKDIQRLALVGGGKIEQWATMTFSTLSFTKCRCFQQGQLDEAWAWLTEG